jgi:hypothetical protein
MAARSKGAGKQGKHRRPEAENGWFPGFAGGISPNHTREKTNAVPCEMIADFVWYPHARIRRKFVSTNIEFTSASRNTYVKTWYGANITNLLIFHSF